MCGDVPPGLAVAAVGGYGRREQAPGSDVDLMFLHAPQDAPRMRELVDTILYPLWDSGLAVSHAMRTVADCSGEAATRLESLTALLDARLVAGSAELVDQARDAARAVVGRDHRAFVEALQRSRKEREERFGSAGRVLEPDLKEGLGGLRDIQILRWLATARTGEHVALDSAGDHPGVLPDALDHFLLVRTALHLAASSRANRLLAEHHQSVAELLGIEDRPDWEARDRLMRDLFGLGRSVEHLTDRALATPPFPVETETILPGDLVGTLRREVGTGILRAADARGTLERFLPGWQGVRGRPQRDPYHRYPVDVHLLETLAEATRLIREPDEAFAVEAAASIGDPTALLLGALYHDIGKVGRGSHVRTGIEVTAEAMAHLGIQGELRDDVLFLVGEHLLLSDTATRRNLEDEDLIVHVAARVGDERRLALLYLLTVADAHATGPTASSPWRLGLIRELVAKVSHAFERGLMDRDRAGRLADAEAALREALVSAQVSPQDAEAFIEAVPSGYVLWASPGDVADHLALISPGPEPTEVRTAVRPGDLPGTYRLAIGAVDRLGLLAAAAGSLSLSGLTIIGAQAFTTEDGLALDIFEVRGAFEEQVAEERWARFRSLIGDALRGTVDLRDRVHALRAQYRQTPAGDPVTVRIDREASDFYTVVEVAAPDRLGLLFDLASAFSRHDLDVHVAKVATYGARVVDVFYVRDSAGQKVNDPARAAELEAALIAAASVS